ncbi:PiggyBac transposable element-derived protein 4 [Plakobranchus ocellatus]|uniref:PiggyBac transposable element-derived protein 4 n=1 Tax=Plakobranchus ocellatus TaxID=259542 RepID=A0AAV4BUP5_9GAST|nr:PiggyBac transposable element-derived protein 4 [Plakobranchus ocellatus]
MDQRIAYYGVFERKSVKWWKKLFYWILEIAQVNTLILYTLAHSEDQTHKKSLKSFKQSLLRHLTSADAEDMPENDVEKRKPGRQPTAGPLERKTGAKHLVAHRPRDRNCVYCSTPQKRVRTHFYCTGCTNNSHLHPTDCFVKYHTE